MVERIPPQSLDSEEALLGSILVNYRVLDDILDLLTKHDFYKESHELIFDAMLELYKKNEPIDIITLKNYLGTNQLLERIGGVSYLSRLTDKTIGASNIRNYAKIIKEKSFLRRVITKCSNLSEEAYSRADYQSFAEEVQKTFYEISDDKLEKKIHPISEIVEERCKFLAELAKNKNEITGVPTGFIDFDTKTTGLQPAQFIIIAARPSMGKTALVLNMAANASIIEQRPVLFFSLEMSKESLVTRIICSESMVDSNRLHTGMASQEEWNRIVQAAVKISGGNLFIDDEGGLSPLEIAARARRLKRKHNIQLIIIDYLQLMRIKFSKKIMPKHEEISEISASLKNIAKELQIPIIALSQLSRECEKRDPPEPKMSDLRESGSIEQDADLVCLIYREAYYKPDTAEKDVTDLIIAKNRTGPTGRVKLKFKKEFTRFENYTNEEPFGTYEY